MTTSDISTSTRRNALVAGAIVLVAVAFGIGYELGNREPAPEAAAVASSPGPDSPMAAAASPMADAGAKKAGSLESLLPGLEARVAADPRNIDNRLLLARTYAELGQGDKSVKTLRTLHRDAPKNVEVVVLLGSSLMQSSSGKDLREAYDLLGDAVRLNPAVSPMARLYQGEILVKLGDNKGAIKVWKDYVRTMPAGDQRRALFEQRIAAASAS